MTVSQPVLCLIALCMAGGTIFEAVHQAQPLAGMTRARFEDNCTSQNGRFGALRDSVICSLSPQLSVVCQYESTLGNCVWSGRIETEALAKMFAVTRDRAATEPA